MAEGTEDQDRFGVVLAADDRYARPLAVVLRSLLENVGPARRPVVYVLSDGMTVDSKARIFRIAQRANAANLIRWVDMESELPREPQGAGHLSRATYARLLMPRLLPLYVERALYLDTDVLVRGDVTELLRLELDGRPIAAARDVMFAKVPHPTLGPVTDYFNAGVLVIDLDAWRTSGFPERVLACAEQRDDLRFADQDAMHVVGTEWQELEPQWNVQLGFLWGPERSAHFREERVRLTRDARIMHFTGSAKPWFFDSPVRGTAMWVQTLLRSGWYTTIEAVRWLLPWVLKRLIARVGGSGAVGAAKRVRAVVGRSRPNHA
jgi:lipopolysaccharide biosynthesis glycosyltransferase